MSRGVSRVVLLLALLVAFLYGALSVHARLFPYTLLSRLHRLFVPAAPTGSGRGPMWFRAREESPTPSELLATLPYLQGYEPATGRQRIVVHDRARAYDGLNLWVSGHAPEAFLMDMDGKILHTWRCDFARAWPGRTVGREDAWQDRFWRHAHLLPNGDLLAIFERLGLVRLDRESRLLWASAEGAHHDLEVEGSRIYVLTRRTRSDGRVEDFITVLEGDGRVARTVSLLRAMENSPYSSLLARLPPRGDLFHTNGLDLVGPATLGRSPLFGPRRALVSLLTLDTIALVDLDREAMVFALTGMWRRQHDPRLLPNGRWLVFDNIWSPDPKASRVMEVDPLTQRVEWAYAGDAGRPFSSEVCGSNQRLPNGNTLIVETTQGRAFEVTPAGEIVWEFVNPFRAGDRGELVAALYGMTRLRPEDLLPGALSAPVDAAGSK